MTGLRSLIPPQTNQFGLYIADEIKNSIKAFSVDHVEGLADAGEIYCIKLKDNTTQIVVSLNLSKQENSIADLEDFLVKATELMENNQPATLQLGGDLGMKLVTGRKDELNEVKQNRKKIADAFKNYFPNISNRLKVDYGEPIKLAEDQQADSMISLEYTANVATANSDDPFQLQKNTTVNPKSFSGESFLMPWQTPFIHGTPLLDRIGAINAESKHKGPEKNMSDMSQCQTISLDKINGKTKQSKNQKLILVACGLSDKSTGFLKEMRDNPKLMEHRPLSESTKAHLQKTITLQIQRLEKEQNTKGDYNFRLFGCVPCGYSKSSKINSLKSLQHILDKENGELTAEDIKCLANKTTGKELRSAGLKL